VICPEMLRREHHEAVRQIRLKGKMRLVFGLGR
jgi:hypothetical protein